MQITVADLYKMIGERECRIELLTRRVDALAAENATLRAPAAPVAPRPGASE